MTEYLLRHWRRSDAAAFRAAVNESLSDLQQWMNWALGEPRSPEDTARQLSEWESDFRLELKWRYAVVESHSGLILGGASIHQRIGMGGRDLGYWLRSSACGRGVMTAVVQQLTSRAFEQQEAERVEIHCDRDNQRSIALAARLGFKIVGEYLRTRPNGEQRISRIYRLERAEFPTPRMLMLRGLPRVSFDD